MKNKKLFLISNLLVAALTIPLAITSSLQTSSRSIAQKNQEEVIWPNITPGQNQDESLDQIQTLIKNPINFRELETLRPKSDNNDESNQWTGVYKPQDWSEILDPELAFYHARENGWTSIEDYENYLRARLELTGGNSEINFASFQEHDWIAWHHHAGGTLVTSYNDGVSSDVRPTWVGSEDQKENNIDNSIPWYLYDRGAKIFAFDNNNLENAFKRLQWLERIVPAEVSEITNEAYTDTTTNQKSYRNHFLVNGEFVSSLDPYANYYYVKDNGSDFVRDSYGWKVLISPNLISGDNKQKFEKLFSTVINPEIETKDPAWQWTERRNFAPLTISVGASQTEIQKLVESSRQMDSIVETEYVKVAYPTNYVINEEYRLGSASLKDDAATWSGLYKLARKSSNFTKMVEDPNTFLPQEMMSNKKIINPYGNNVPWTFTHPFNGGGYNFLWVENGHGGRKVWKNLYYNYEDRITNPFILDVTETEKAIEDFKNQDQTNIDLLNSVNFDELWLNAKKYPDQIMTIKYGSNLLLVQMLMPFLATPDIIKFKPNPNYNFDKNTYNRLLSANVPIVFSIGFDLVTSSPIAQLDPTVSQEWQDAYDTTKTLASNIKNLPVQKGLEYMVRDNAQGQIKFYGNYMHIFPGTPEGLQWFKDLTDEYNRFGF